MLGSVATLSTFTGHLLTVWSYSKLEQPHYIKSQSTNQCLPQSRFDPRNADLVAPTYQIKLALARGY